MKTKSFDKQKKVPLPAGYPKDDAKTSGIVTRGNGAAKRGKKARGPMA